MSSEVRMTWKCLFLLRVGQASEPKTQLKGIVDICSNVVKIPLHSLKGVLKSGAIKRAHSVLSHPLHVAMGQNKLTQELFFWLLDNSGLFIYLS